MNLDALAALALILAAIPCGLFLVNLLIYRPPVRSWASGPCDGAADEDADSEAISVLIPARNEATNIRAAVNSVLANRGVSFEILVLDDGSTDGTRRIVEELAAQDPRVRLELAPPLPPGWCGKPFACHVLARRASHPWLVFMDADVRLAPDALARLSGFMRTRNASLGSGVPLQQLGGFLERLLIPLIHFVLLGFLPMYWMRRRLSPAFAAGCGQLFIARAADYFRAGGHAAIRDTLHDGLKLPQLFRRAGFRTDLFDATDVASCRMYQTDAEVWRGLGKNATEGLAAPGRILPMTGLLFGGQVLPFIVLSLAPGLSGRTLLMASTAAALAWLPRLVGAWRFRQSWLGACLHPLGILCLLVIQWMALARSLLGRPSTWRGRSYPAGATAAFALCAALTVQTAVGAENDQAAARVRIADFSLSDQYGQLHHYQFPRTNLTILAVADRQGSAQILSWVRPIKKRYGTEVAIDGLADLSPVPAPLRGMITRKFRNIQEYPVMLDWKGEVCRSFGYRAEVANIYVIDGLGRVLHRRNGAATEEGLREIFAALEGSKP